jgi:hypothetical protein
LQTHRLGNDALQGLERVFTTRFSALMCSVLYFMLCLISASVALCRTCPIMDCVWTAGWCSLLPAVLVPVTPPPRSSTWIEPERHGRRHILPILSEWGDVPLHTCIIAHVAGAPERRRLRLGLYANLITQPRIQRKSSTSTHNISTPRRLLQVSESVQLSAILTICQTLIGGLKAASRRAR